MTLQNYLSNWQNFCQNSEFSCSKQKDKQKRWTSWTLKQSLEKRISPCGQWSQSDSRRERRAAPPLRMWACKRLQRKPPSGPCRLQSRWGRRGPGQIWKHRFAHSRIMERLTLKRRGISGCCLGFIKTWNRSRGNTEMCSNPVCFFPSELTGDWNFSSSPHLPLHLRCWTQCKRGASQVQRKVRLGF